MYVESTTSQFLWVLQSLSLMAAFLPHLRTHKGTRPLLSSSSWLCLCWLFAASRGGHLGVVVCAGWACVPLLCPFHLGRAPLSNASYVLGCLEGVEMLSVHAPQNCFRLPLPHPHNLLFSIFDSPPFWSLCNLLLIFFISAPFPLASSVVLTRPKVYL